MEEGCFYCKCFIKDSDKVKKESSVSDIPGCKNHLHNWERWLKERKHTNQSLSKRLKRPKDHLLMNSTEEERKIMEEKILFVNDKNYAYFDKYRGNPEWFKLRPRLHQRCRNDPIIEAVVLKAEKREVVPIVYVETPTRILKEKDILPRTRNFLARWQKGTYRQEVFKRIRKNMKFLEPHRPNLSELIVTGHKIGGPKKKTDDKCLGGSCKGTDSCIKKDCHPPKPVFDIHLCPNIFCNTCDSVSITVNSLPATSLIINGIEITPAIIEKGKMKMRLLFTSNLIPKVPIQKSIIFENCGSTTLRIQFHKQKKFRTFRDIIPHVRISTPFYFNKDEIILLPRQKIDLPIWFKTPKTGHFIESWEMTTSPKLWTDSFIFTISLQGIVYRDDCYFIAKGIESMLESRIRYTLVKEIIKDIIDTTKFEQSQLYTYTYTEKDLFESINMEKWGMAIRPKYLYDKDIVMQLKKLYYTVRCNDDPPHWNYSVKTLKEATRKRDVLDFIDNLYKECMKVKDRAEVLREMYDVPNTQQKTDGDKSTVEVKTVVSGRQPVGAESKIQAANHPSSDHKITYARYYELNKFLQKLERAVMIPNSQRSKYSEAFFIWRFYLNKISNELDSYNTVTDIDYHKIRRIEDLPERLIFERFDNIWARRTRLVKLDSTTQNKYPAKPKPKFLEEIPPDDLEAVYQTYVGRQSSQEKDNKKKIIKPQEAPSKAKNIMSKNNLNPDREIEGFDPYADVVSEIVNATNVMHQRKLIMLTELDQSGSTNSLIPSPIPYQEKYLIVYTNLCAAIDALVNTIETMSEKKISIPTLGELARCKVVNTETTYLEKPISPTESRIDASSDEYYQYLIDTYLKDPQTQDYFIGEKTVPIVEKLQEFFSSSTSDMRFDRTYTSMEYLIMEVKEEAKITAGVQTSETDEFLKPISNILIRPDIISHSYIVNEELLYEESETPCEEEPPEEHFYIVESSECLPPEADQPSNPGSQLW